MIKTDAGHLLFVHPTSAPSAEPTLDDATRRVVAAWRARSTLPGGTRGFHRCTGTRCRAHSDNREHLIIIKTMTRQVNLMTNSLCVHYVAHHRAALSPHDLQQIMLLPEALGPIWCPTRDELALL